MAPWAAKAVICTFSPPVQTTIDFRIEFNDANMRYVVAFHRFIPKMKKKKAPEHHTERIYGLYG